MVQACAPPYGEIRLGNGGTVPGDLVNGREWGSHRPPFWMFSNQAREEGL